MSGAPGGNQDDLLDLSFDPTGSCMPPPLRPPALSQAQLRAAIELGFSNKYLPTTNSSTAPPNVRNGREPVYRQASTDSYSYPSADINNSGPYSAPDLSSNQFMSGDYVDGQGNGNFGRPGEQEGLLPPLRRPHINEIPPDVLAVLLKNARFEEIIGPIEDSQGSSLSSDQTRTAPRNDNNHNTYHNHPHQQSHSQTNMSQQSTERQQQQRNSHGVMSQNCPNPNNASPQQNSGRSHQTRGSDKSSNSSPKPLTGLSPMAKPFYPSGHPMMAPPPVNPMNDWMNSQEEAELAEAVAQFQLQAQQCDQGQENYDYNNMGTFGGQQCAEDNSDFVLSTVTDAITDLTKHPANFNRCAKSITDVVKSYVKDLETLVVVVTLIVEQSISNPNFCYSGARLSQVLHKSGISLENKTFKALLLQRCQEEFQAGIAKIQDHNGMIRCRGILMFFGELFVNVRIEKKDGVTTPIAVIGLGILEMMQNLVKGSIHENIKCIFQILKLVGWELENSADKRIKDNFEQLMKDLSYICVAESDIKPQTKLLLDTLFQIKNKKWNREESVEEKPCPSPASSSFSAGNNFFELPESDEDDFGDEDCILLDDEPEEVRLAYEEFLKTANK